MESVSLQKKKCKPLSPHTHNSKLWQKRNNAPNAKAGISMFLLGEKSSAAIADMMNEPQEKSNLQVLQCPSQEAVSIGSELK
jgi:hypothetical protein